MGKNSREKSLRKREKKVEICRKLAKYERMYVVSGGPADILRYFTMTLIAPGAYWCFVFGIPKDWRWILIFYLAFDLFYTLSWFRRILSRKKWDEEPPLEEGGESLESILKKIEELSDETPIAYGYTDDENGEWTDLFHR